MQKNAFLIIVENRTIKKHLKYTFNRKKSKTIK